MKTTYKVNVREIFGIIISNIKIEMLIFIACIIFLIINSRQPFDLCNISTYLDKERLDKILDFFSLGIGIYVAIISILATTNTNISVKIAEKKLDNSLILVTCIGLLESILLIIFIIFSSNLSNESMIMLSFLILSSFVSFIKFFILVIYIFKYNISSLPKQVDEENQFKNDVLLLLERIESNTRDEHNK